MKNLRKSSSVFSSMLGIGSLFLILALSFAGCKNPAGSTVHVHEWGEWEFKASATCVAAGTEERICVHNSTHRETRNNPDEPVIPTAHDMAWVPTLTASATTNGLDTYTCQRTGCNHTDGSKITHATGTAGLSYTLINSNTEYSVSGGTVNTGMVYIPVYHRPDASSEYLPVTRVAVNAFYNQPGITGVTFLSDSKIDYIDNDAFRGTGLTSIIIPAGVTYIGNGSFASCSELTSVTFAPGSQLKTIYRYAFQSAIKLTSIEIPASVIEIDMYGFAYCSNLETVTFATGSQLDYIGTYAFRDSTKISTLTIPASIKDSTSGPIVINAFAGWISEQTIIVPFANLAEMLSVLGVPYDPDWKFTDCNAAVQYTL